MLAPTEPPEATLLWDTRQSQPALKLAPDAGDRTLVRKGDASVLGNAMAMRLWLPQSQLPQTAFSIGGHENGRILAWDPGHARAANLREDTSKFISTRRTWPSTSMRKARCSSRGGVEAKAQAFRVEPGLLKPHGSLDVTCGAVNELDQHPGVGQLALRGDGKVTASAGWDYRVRLFSAKSLKRLAVLRYHDASSKRFGLVLDLLATGSKDTKVAVVAAVAFTGFCLFLFSCVSAAAARLPSRVVSLIVTSSRGEPSTALGLRRRRGAVRPDRRRRRRPDDDGPAAGTRRPGRREALVGSGGGAEITCWGLLWNCPGYVVPALGSAATLGAPTPRDVAKRSSGVTRAGARVARRRQVHLGVLVEELPRRDLRPWRLVVAVQAASGDVNCGDAAGRGDAPGDAGAAPAPRRRASARRAPGRRAAAARAPPGARARAAAAPRPASPLIDSARTRSARAARAASSGASGTPRARRAP